MLLFSKIPDNIIEYIKNISNWHVFLILLLISSHIVSGTPVQENIPKINSSLQNQITPLIGVFAPVQYHNSEMDITDDSLLSFEKSIRSNVSIATFSHEWGINRTFPDKQIDIIHDLGAVPYIRLMLRSSNKQYRPEPVFTLSRILQGIYDEDLRAWARHAREKGYPILVEYGTEVNGWWFSWNGYWTGKTSGPEQFVKTYQHIIDIFKEEGAFNVLWVYHVNWNNNPQEEWNTFQAYYPGDEYIDLLGLSVYGSLSPLSEENLTFQEMTGIAYPELKNISQDKPILVSEMGSDINNQKNDAVYWTDSAFSDLFSGRWPGIIGFIWWNAAWPNDNIPSHNTSMRVEDSIMLQRVFQKWTM